MRIQIERFRALYNEVLFVDMEPEGGDDFSVANTAESLRDANIQRYRDATRAATHTIYRRISRKEPKTAGQSTTLADNLRWV